MYFGNISFRGFSGPVGCDSAEYTAYSNAIEAGAGFAAATAAGKAARDACERDLLAMAAADQRAAEGGKTKRTGFQPVINGKTKTQGSAIRGMTIATPVALGTGLGPVSTNSNTPNTSGGTAAPAVIPFTPTDGPARVSDAARAEQERKALAEAEWKKKNEAVMAAQAAAEEAARAQAEAEAQAAADAARTEEERLAAEAEVAWLQSQKKDSGSAVPLAIGAFLIKVLFF